jgi:hypothetical protein
MTDSNAPKTYTLELKEREVILLINALRTAQDWLKDQKGNFGGALIGISKLDSICWEIAVLADKPHEASSLPRVITESEENA